MLHTTARIQREPENGRKHVENARKSVENLARNFAVEHASETRKLMENAREPAETRSELGLRKCAARRKAARVSGGFPQVSWRFLLA